MTPLLMRLSTLVLVAAASVAAAAGAGLPEHPWGTDQQQVRESAAGELIIGVPGRLIHHAEYRGVPVTVNRRFDSDGGLRQVRYFNRSSHADPADYIDDFEEFRRHVAADYGEPELDVREWRSEALREQPGMEGMALAGNKLVLIAGWQTPEALVLMTLQREHTAMGHRLIFTDPDADSDAFPAGE